MRKVQEYRDHARRCELLLERVEDLRVRQRLRRERQEWLELAATCEAALRNERWTGETPLDRDMTPAALRAFERDRWRAPPREAAPDPPPSSAEPGGAGEEAADRAER